MAKPEVTLLEPLVITIATATQISGISRAELYRRLAAGKICAVKSGRRTLINLASLKAHVAAMPEATFRTKTAVGGHD